MRSRPRMYGELRAWFEGLLTPFHKSTRHACAKNILRLSASVVTLSVHQSGERFLLVRKMIEWTAYIFHKIKSDKLK